MGKNPSSKGCEESPEHFCMAYAYSSTGAIISWLLFHSLIRSRKMNLNMNTFLSCVLVGRRLLTGEVSVMWWSYKMVAIPWNFLLSWNVTMYLTTWTKYLLLRLLNNTHIWMTDSPISPHDQMEIELLIGIDLIAAHFDLNIALVRTVRHMLKGFLWVSHFRTSVPW